MKSHACNVAQQPAGHQTGGRQNNHDRRIPPVLCLTPALCLYPELIATGVSTCRHLPGKTHALVQTECSSIWSVMENRCSQRNKPSGNSDTFDSLLWGIADTQQLVELGDGQDFIDVRCDATQT